MTPDEKSVLYAIECAQATIARRLRAKGPMYSPDAEWTRLRAASVALRLAARELERGEGLTKRANEG